MLENEKVENKFDILRMYFGDDYYLTDKFVIKQPTIGQILEYGEPEFFSMISYLCSNPTSMRLALWQQGINWNDVDDYELFISILRGFEKEETEILFGDIDCTKFTPISDDNGDVILVYIPDTTINMDRKTVMRMIEYLRALFDIHPKVEKARGRATAEAIIDEELMNIRNQERLKENNGKQDYWKKSVLFPLISSALNHPGFNYKKSELKDVGIFEFMDSIKRLQIYESVTSFMTGMYMGMIDTKQIDLKKELNWTRDIYE